MPAGSHLGERRVQLGEDLKAIADIQRFALGQRSGTPVAFAAA
jgi:hypothetical protein